jgi:hypothetical protein
MVERAPEAETSSHPDTAMAGKQRCGGRYRKILLEGLSQQVLPVYSHARNLKPALTNTVHLWAIHDWAIVAASPFGDKVHGSKWLLYSSIPD